MTLPVSSYEELLIQVRQLTHETILLQHQLSSDLFDNADPPDVNHNFSYVQKNYEKGNLLTDNVIRHCDKTREIETGQNPFVECNLRSQPRYCHDLESSESNRSGELTSRLLAWRSRDRYHPIALQGSPFASEREKPEHDETARGEVEFNSQACAASVRGKIIGGVAATPPPPSSLPDVIDQGPPFVFPPKWLKYIAPWDTRRIGAPPFSFTRARARAKLRNA
ncbi:uncharacterized protein LOC109851768 isoform X2 [Pseudomyrmex gracilis]|uniref:uncharacterized protein LOC109851768 isoform X2 n=1 Tax=Pseudomyrmex gracilis TaxID=219809 RepID=UPI00099591C2|nr:uncharacterized protein LOC109851768 isoform X2 [Pseudomyrmex gracilis]